LAISNQAVTALAVAAFVFNTTSAGLFPADPVGRVLQLLQLGAE
jgi:hypothetical protein